jgi:hypothetical protein
MCKNYRVRKELAILSCIAAGLVSVALIIAISGRCATAEVAAAAEQPDYTQPAISGGNNALLFDGVDDYIQIPEIGAIRSKESEPLTVEFWLFVPSWPDNWQKVVSKWGSRGGDDDEFVISLGHNGTYGFANTGRTGLDSNTTLPANIWRHFCCVWDSANGHYALYLNGERVPQSLKGGDALRLTGEPIRIGTDGHHNQWFRGIIDELRIWNVARSRVVIIRDMYRKLKGDEPGLKGYWDFDEGEGQVVDDLSESGNRGKLGRLPFPDDSDPKWVASGVELIDAR